MKGLRTSLLLCALVAAGVTPTADAATATTILPVTATVLATCIVVATPLIFGNYSAAQVDAQAALTVTCTLGTPFVVRLDAGAGAGATIAARQLSFGANTLAYSLYRDAARTQNWGRPTAPTRLPAPAHCCQSSSTSTAGFRRASSPRRVPTSIRSA